MQDKIQSLVTQLGLLPHPEGGYYKEVYRSEEVIPASALAEKYEGERNCCTSIYFMLTSTAFSAFHRIAQDEIWHFYQGAPIDLHLLSPEGEHTLIKLGHNFLAGEVPQAVVPAGYWFGAEVAGENNFSLVGCTVSPGFDFRDFELAERETLTQAFPQHSALIHKLSRS